ncbi:hypothetical protein E9993_03190 [Labilibacter sediminis]|nr:hypothetical protein E9993_03190 [Labilibacter sediminis]
MGFFENIVDVCEKADMAQLGITEQVAELKVFSDSMVGNLFNKRGNKLSKALEMLDKQREADIKLLRQVSNSYLRHFAEHKRNAAILLLQSIDKYGKNIYQLNYSGQTTVLASLGEELQTETSLIDAVSVLNVKDVVDHMVEVNRKFDDIFVDRIRDKAENKTVFATEIIAKAKVAWVELEAYLNAYTVLNPSEELTFLIKTMNKFVDKYNQTINARVVKKDQSV